MVRKVPIEQLRGRTIGRILIKMGLLTREKVHHCLAVQKKRGGKILIGQIFLELRSEEHTSELQSHSFISYAVFCLKKKIN